MPIDPFSGHADYTRRYEQMIPYGLPTVWWSEQGSVQIFSQRRSIEGSVVGTRPALSAVIHRDYFAYAQTGRAVARPYVDPLGLAEQSSSPLPEFGEGSGVGSEYDLSEAI